MKKVTLLCLARRKDETLQALRDIGVLHVTPLRSPAGRDIETARDKVNEAHQAEQVLKGIVAEEKHHEKSSDRVRDFTPEEAVHEVLDALSRRKKERETLGELRGEYERIAPFGDFDPAEIRLLAEHGIIVNLCRAKEGDPIVPPEGTVLNILTETSNVVYFSLSGPAKAFDSADFPYEPARLPEQRLSMLGERIEEVERDIADINEELAELATRVDDVDQVAREREEHLRFLEVRTGMEDEGQVALLQGFCPEPNLEDLRKAVKENGWGLVISDPDPEDSVPTLVKYPRWVRPIKAVFDMLEIHPGYHEADISMAFLIFFSLFFAMLIGDAGYGALFLGTTLLARAKFRKAPAYPFHLMIILSAATIIFGALNGNYFGITDLPAPLRAFRVEWLGNQDNIMELCFLIGAIHLTLAHTWNAIILFPSLRALAQGGWVCLTWTMFFGARTMVLNQSFPILGFFLLVIGVILVVLFMTPRKDLSTDWIHHAMLPLNIISCFIDLVSYIRLFAVGMATLSVAETFNNMAAQAGFDSIWTGLLAALILVAGHGLNILLCALGVLVHGVRLNTLEFSLHKNMQWSGFPYNPFSKKEEAH